MKRILAMAIVLAASAAGADEYWAQATFVKGSVEAQGASGATPIALGSVLHRGDVVKAPAGSSASFLLSDGAVLVVRGPKEATIGGDASAAPRLGTVAQNLSKSLLAREGNNPMMKHLGGLRSAGRNLALAPTRTAIRAGAVTLRWLAAPRAKGYLVTLMGPNDELAETKVSGTELAIAADKIRPGETYYWEVRDAANADAMSALGSGTFSVLDAASASAIAALESAVTAGLAAGDPESAFSARFLIYQIRRENGLALEALLELEQMIGLHPDDATLLRWRNDVLAEMGLQEGDQARISAS